MYLGNIIPIEHMLRMRIAGPNALDEKCHPVSSSQLNNYELNLRVTKSPYPADHIKDWETI